MPKKYSKRKAFHECKKYCHCNPFCNKKLTQQAWCLHYKQLRPEQLDAVHNSSMATVSDYSSNSRKFSTSSFTDSVKNSLLDEKILQIGYDGSRKTKNKNQQTQKAMTQRGVVIIDQMMKLMERSVVLSKITMNSLNGVVVPVVRQAKHFQRNLPVRENLKGCAMNFGLRVTKAPGPTQNLMNGRITMRTIRLWLYSQMKRGYMNLRTF